MFADGGCGCVGAGDCALSAEMPERGVVGSVADRLVVGDGGEGH